MNDCKKKFHFYNFNCRWNNIKISHDKDVVVDISEKNSYFCVLIVYSRSKGLHWILLHCHIFLSSLPKMGKNNCALKKELFLLTSLPTYREKFVFVRAPRCCG